MRTHPANYASILSLMLKSTISKVLLAYWTMRYLQTKTVFLPGCSPMFYEEGTKVIQEASQELNGLGKLPALSYSRALSQAARDHAKDIGCVLFLVPTYLEGNVGVTGHKGTDGSSPGTRISRYCTWGSLVGECIDYGMLRGNESVKCTF